MESGSTPFCGAPISLLGSKPIREGAMPDPDAVRRVIDSYGDRISTGGVQALKALGMNQTQISDVYGITRAAVSDFVRRHGINTARPRQRLLEEYMPWEVRTEQKTYVYQVLGWHLMFMVNGGKRALEPSQFQRLVGFYRTVRVNDVALEYDPEIPPSDFPGSKHGGWAFRPRQDFDGRLILRRNELVRDLPEEYWKTWRLPERLPILE